MPSPRFRNGHQAQPSRLACAIFTVLVALCLPHDKSCCMALKQPHFVPATSTTVPPLVDVPTFSMATRNIHNNNDDGTTSTTNMNILTYATPVSVRPDRVWSIGLYKETLSYQNFCRDRTCILQLLTEQHVPLVKPLGGSSGRDVDKRQECETLGFPWGNLPEKLDDDVDETAKPRPQVLPGCAYYLRLTAIGDIVDCGSHCVAICKVQEMFVSNNDDDNDDGKTGHLSTATLRDLGIITEQGRVAED